MRTTATPPEVLEALKNPPASSAASYAHSRSATDTPEPRLPLGYASPAPLVMARVTINSCRADRASGPDAPGRTLRKFLIALPHSRVA
jgi:hypothetical protein